MEIEKLIAAVKLCGSSPRVGQCRECAYWAGGDMSKCIPRMTADASTTLEQLQAENEGDGCYIEGEKYHCENFKWRGPQKEE